MGDMKASLLQLLSGPAGLVSLLGFVTCLSPKLEFYYFRQQGMGLTAPQQALTSMIGSFGWWLGTTCYKKYISSRKVHLALKTCLVLWPIGSILQILIAVISGHFVRSDHTSVFLILAGLEKLATEFCTTLTYMPCMVLFQLHSPKGCEGTAFSFMQCSGTIGMFFGRNLEWLLMSIFGVSNVLGL